MSRPYGVGDLVRNTEVLRRTDPTPGSAKVEILDAGSPLRVTGIGWGGVSGSFVTVVRESTNSVWMVDASKLERIPAGRVEEATGNAIHQTLAERSRYGEFKDNAMLAQSLKGDLRGFPGWQKMAPHQRQALDVIMDKVSRIVCGDPNYRDNWHDIQGYARLVEERLPDPGKPPQAGAAGLSGYYAPTRNPA